MPAPTEAAIPTRNVRQVLTAAADARVAAEESRATTRTQRGRQAELTARLGTLEGFFSLLDAGIGAFLQGEPFHAQELRNVVPLQGGPRRQR